MSLMNIPQPDLALREAFRAPQPGGFLQFAITHPCFDTPQRGWVRDGAGRKVAYQSGDYFTQAQGRVEEWLFSTAPPEVRQGLPPFRAPKFFRTLSAWVNDLLDTGFALERLDEPFAGEGTARRFPDLAGTRIVPFWLMMRCRKPVDGRCGEGLSLRIRRITLGSMQAPAPVVKTAFGTSRARDGGAG
jgi:hypothetical protein